MSTGVLTARRCTLPASSQCFSSQGKRILTELYRCQPNLDLLTSLYINSMTFTTPEAAEAAFYSAFQSRDLALMMETWESGEDILCIHPLAAPLNGRSAVTAGWKSIFEAAEHFSLYTEVAHQMHDATHAIHVVREHLAIGQETGQRPPILSTNIYRKENAGWRMVLHHASPLQVGGPHVSHPPSQILH